MGSKMRSGSPGAPSFESQSARESAGNHGQRRDGPSDMLRSDCSYSAQTGAPVAATMAQRKPRWLRPNLSRGAPRTMVPLAPMLSQQRSAGRPGAIPLAAVSPIPYAVSSYSKMPGGKAANPRRQMCALRSERQEGHPRSLGGRRQRHPYIRGRGDCRQNTTVADYRAIT